MYLEGYSAKEIADNQNTTKESINATMYYLRSNGKVEKRIFHNQKQGERHNVAKLKESDVKNIILMRLKGKTYAEIAKKYNISPTTPRNICIGKTWKHLFAKYKGRLEIIKMKS